MGPNGGDKRDRTVDPLLAKQVLSQLSYTPIYLRQGRAPSKLNNVRYSSKHPTSDLRTLQKTICFLSSPEKGGDPAARSRTATLLRLHPNYRTHLRPRPLLLVRLRTSGVPDSHGVTGGVYKARERIHRGMLIRDY